MTHMQPQKGKKYNPGLARSAWGIFFRDVQHGASRMKDMKGFDDSTCEPLHYFFHLSAGCVSQIRQVLQSIA